MEQKNFSSQRLKSWLRNFLTNIWNKCDCKELDQSQINRLVALNGRQNRPVSLWEMRRIFHMMKVQVPMWSTAGDAELQFYREMGVEYISVCFMKTTGIMRAYPVCRSAWRNLIWKSRMQGSFSVFKNPIIHLGLDGRDERLIDITALLPWWGVQNSNLFSGMAARRCSSFLQTCRTIYAWLGQWNCRHDGDRKKGIESWAHLFWRGNLG